MACISPTGRWSRLCKGRWTAGTSTSRPRSSAGSRSCTFARATKSSRAMCSSRSTAPRFRPRSRRRRRLAGRRPPSSSFWTMEYERRKCASRKQTGNAGSPRRIWRKSRSNGSTRSTRTDWSRSSATTRPRRRTSPRSTPRPLRAPSMSSRSTVSARKSALPPPRSLSARGRRCRESTHWPRTSRSSRRSARRSTRWCCTKASWPRWVFRSSAWSISTTCGSSLICARRRSQTSRSTRRSPARCLPSAGAWLLSRCITSVRRASTRPGARRGSRAATTSRP